MDDTVLVITENTTRPQRMLGRVVATSTKHDALVRKGSVRIGNSDLYCKGKRKVSLKILKKKNK